MLPGKAGHLPADRDPVTSREAIVHPAIDARLGNLVDRLGEFRVSMHGMDQSRNRAVDRESELVGPKEAFEGFGDRPTRAAMRRRVLRMIGRDR